jgi:hypothetical protein
MLSFYIPKTQLINKALNDYCKKSTENSMRKITEQYNLERNEPKIVNSLVKVGGNNNPDFNFYGLFAFLSISTMALFFYKKLY